MGAKALVIYDDFRGGDWGTLGAKLAAKNQFSALNMLVYQDGTIGPRAGVTQFQGAVGMTQPPHAFGRRAGTTEVWWGWDDGANLNARFRATDAIIGLSFAYAGTPAAGGTGAEGQSWDESDDDRSYFATTSGVAKIDHGAGTLNLLGGPSPAGKCLVRYGDRLLTTSGPNIRYSAPANFGSWPVANTIPVGASNIRGLFVMRGQLVIIKDDYGIWILSGVPGVNEYLREVIPRYDGFVDNFRFTAADVERLSRLWMASPGFSAPSYLSPSIFAGSVPRDYTEHELEGYRQPVLGTPWSAPESSRGMVTSMHKVDSVALLTASRGASLGDPNAMVRHNGVWTYHSLNISPAPTENHPLFVQHMGNGRLVIAAENDTDWALYNWQAAVDTVPVVGADHYGLMTVNDFGDPLNHPNCYLYLSEFEDKDGREFTVRTITVDVRVWINGNGIPGDDPTIACRIDRLSRDNAGVAGNGLDESLGTQTWSIPAGTSDGEHHTIEFGFEPESGRSLRIYLSDIKALAVRRVTVYGDYDSART